MRKPKIPLKTIVGPINPPCLHAQHYPPTHMVFRPGTYQHRCPGCGHVTTFFVDAPIW